jgi:hypothetical protein
MTNNNFISVLEELEATVQSMGIHTEQGRKWKGAFHFTKADKLTAKIKEAEVVEGYGVYAFFGCRDEGAAEELLYIGKSGTIQQDGRLCDQGLNGRIGNKQERMRREMFFGNILDGKDGRALGFNSIRIEWIETYRNGKGIPPFLAEAQLLANYLREFEALPPLNNEV